MRKLILLSTILILLPFAYSLKVYDVECFDDGHLEVTLEGINESKKAYTRDIAIRTDDVEVVSGSWNSEFIEKSAIANRKYGQFTSKEGIFKENKLYTLYVNYLLIENLTAQYNQRLDVKLVCPGLLFSCALLNVSISDCYTQGDKFSAMLNVQGLRQSDRTIMEPDKVLSFRIKAENNYLNTDKVDSREGSLPQEYSIDYLENDLYLLKFDFKDNKVNSLFVGFNDNTFSTCSQIKYENVKFYDLKTCTVKEAVEEEQKTDSIETNQGQIEEEPKQEQKDEQASESKTSAQDSDLNPKNIIILAVIVAVIGLIIVFFLKRRDINS